ncbi:DUF2975 domain-containing protein [Sphingomonas sp. RP10(2022)]|uniref:DUF2975 domain-containing protein n=1 Tax=Sphingomonas liriopis TaxID=2949094 RepID=A0A9X2HUK8_9SPHN|nr:DUF2975 domain-containing protein [Sphingomonas liriopis]MCP3733773.1 DUF2975 domain-containing protein [Sphingomonas liriopis]
MTRSDRLLKASILVVQAFRIANAAAVFLFVAALIATLPGAEWVEAALLRKYHHSVDPGAVIAFMQVTMLLSLPVGYAIERLLAALRAMLRTVQDGEPFVGTNAARLRTIGWMLLVVQFADLALGGVTAVAGMLHIEFLPWQPSFTGWIAVLIAFVLAQVFERGAALQADLDGTV